MLLCRCENKQETPIGTDTITLTLKLVNMLRLGST